MTQDVKQAVIIAGGMGTRLKPFTDTKPKPMYPFQNRPFIEYLVRQVKEFGITDILILVGYLPDIIRNELKTGESYGVHITYDVTPVEYETGRRLRAALPKLQDTFLFLYCDNYCPVNYAKLLEEYGRNDALIQLTAYANRDGYTKDNLKLAADGQVLLYDKKRVTQGLHGVDIGYALVNRQAIELLPDENVNFEAYIYPQLVQEGRLYAAVCEHRYYSVGSWERIKLTEAFFSQQKIIFLDRDGTINERPPKACYVETPEQFVWLPGAKEAIRLLNEDGYKVVLISNQPGIARGNLTWASLGKIHERMQAQLQEVGAHIDGIYVCPHNWDEGCFCRKPNPGLLYQAQRDYSADLTHCIFIGDDDRDMEAARRAGMKGIQVTERYCILDAVKDILRGEKTL